MEYEEQRSLTKDIQGCLFTAHIVSCNTQCRVWLDDVSYFHEHLFILSMTNVLTALMSDSLNSNLPLPHFTWSSQKVIFSSLLHLAQAMFLYVTLCFHPNTGSSLINVIFNFLTALQSSPTGLPDRLQDDFMIIPDHAGSLKLCPPWLMTSPQVTFWFCITSIILAL